MKAEILYGFNFVITRSTSRWRHGVMTTIYGGCDIFIIMTILEFPTLWVLYELYVLFSSQIKRSDQLSK